MKTLNLLVAALIFFSFIIFIGMGHAAVPLGFLEIFLIPSFFAAGSGLNSLYDIPFFIFTLIALIAHILLLLSFLIKKTYWKIIVVITAQVFLLATITYFVTDHSPNNARGFTLAWSIPVVINIAVLTIYLINARKHWMPDMNHHI